MWPRGPNEYKTDTANNTYFILLSSIQQFIEIIKNIEFNNLWGIKLEVSKNDSL